VLYNTYEAGAQPEAMSRKGYWVVKQKTAADRFRRALKRIAEWCRQYRHEQFASSGQHSSGSRRGTSGILPLSVT
jgi:hypothetical protein